MVRSFVGHGRHNGKMNKDHVNRIRKNAFWICEHCGMKVSGTRRQIQRTQAVHTCGMEDIGGYPTPYVRL
jgi:RNA polymerase-binding transcription factor DksA